MKLSEYLVKNHLIPAKFAHMIGAKSRVTVGRYVRGERFPNDVMMKRIEEVTNGEVTRADFLEERGWVTIHHTKCPDKPPKDYPWSRQEYNAEQRVNRALKRMRKEPKEGTTLSPPLQKAINVLGLRVRMDKDKRNFRLDGRPAGAQDVVRAANRILKARSQPEIPYPLLLLPQK